MPSLSPAELEFSKLRHRRTWTLRPHYMPSFRDLYSLTCTCSHQLSFLIWGHSRCSDCLIRRKIDIMECMKLDVANHQIRHITLTRVADSTQFILIPRASPNPHMRLAALAFSLRSSHEPPHSWPHLSLDSASPSST